MKGIIPDNDALKYIIQVAKHDFSAALQIYNRAVCAAAAEHYHANAEKNAPKPTISHIRQHLINLYNIVRPPFAQHDEDADEGDNDNDNDSEDTHSSGWDSNDDDECNNTWPSPPTTPIEGDDMHPPQLHVCGQHPGQGWDANLPGTKNYFRILVADPSSG